MKKYFVLDDKHEVKFGTKWITVKDLQEGHELKVPRDDTSLNDFDSVLDEFDNLHVAKSRAMRLSTIDIFHTVVLKSIHKHFPRLLYDKDISDIFADHYRRFCRIVGSWIYDALSVTHTEYVTLDALKMINNEEFKKGDWCEEHVHARQRSGQYIIKELYAGTLTSERFVELCDIFCEIAHTTSTENRILEKHQSSTDDIFNWQESYNLAGIPLFKIVGGYYGPLTAAEDMDGNIHTITDIIKE